MTTPQAAVAYIDRQKQRVRAQARRQRIVFPEGGDPRIAGAAARLQSEGLVEPLLIGTFDVPHARQAAYADFYYQRRKAKGVTEAEAVEIARRPLYQAALMVALGDGDGFVGGAANTTAETVRAALHAIGTAPGVKTVSSVFVMAVQNPAMGHGGLLAFADCAVVIQPGAAELADIAIATARNVPALLDAPPVVAMLAFSTKGSGTGEQVDRVREALRLVRERAPDLAIDGELQADAALVATIGQSKAPGSAVAGRANTLIFPDLMAANIGYKLVERLGNAVAFGPILQGLAKPANDLSRGCSEEDVYVVSLLTALQAENG